MAQPPRRRPPTTPPDSPPEQSSTTGPCHCPEKKIGPFTGGIAVTVWKNTVQTEHRPRSYRSVTISPRRYQDRLTGQWKDSNSLNPGDLPEPIAKRGARRDGPQANDRHRRCQHQRGNEVPAEAGNLQSM